jgi:hypothetical protein
LTVFKKLWIQMIKIDETGDKSNKKPLYTSDKSKIEIDFLEGGKE